MSLFLLMLCQPYSLFQGMSKFSSFYNPFFCLTLYSNASSNPLFSLLKSKAYCISIKRMLSLFHTSNKLVCKFKPHRDVIEGQMLIKEMSRQPQCTWYISLTFQNLHSLISFIGRKIFVHIYCKVFIRKSISVFT